MASSTEGADGVFDFLKAETLRAMMRDLGQPGLRKREEMIGYLKDLSANTSNEAEATSSSKSKAASKSSSKTARPSSVTTPVRKTTRFSTADVKPEVPATRAARALVSSSASSRVPVTRSTQKAPETSTAPATRSTRKSISAPVPVASTRSGRKRKAEEKGEEEEADDSASAEPESASTSSPKRARMSTRSGKLVGDEDVEMVDESISTGPLRGRSSAASRRGASSRMEVSVSVSPKTRTHSRSRTRAQRREVDLDQYGDVGGNDEIEPEESISTALRRGRSRGGNALDPATSRKRRGGSGEEDSEAEEESVSDKVAVEPKRGRGRPRKYPKVSSEEASDEQESGGKRAESSTASQSRRPRGRPPKSNKTKSPPKSISPESPDTEEYENSEADADSDADEEMFMDTVVTEKITRRGRPRRRSSATPPLATHGTQNPNETPSASIATSRPARTVRRPKSPIPRTLTTPPVKVVKRTYSRKKRNSDSSARTRARSPKPRSAAKPQPPPQVNIVDNNRVRARSNFVGVVLAPFGQMRLKEKEKEKDQNGVGHEADEDADGEHDIDMEHFNENGGVVENNDPPRLDATEGATDALNGATEEVTETEPSPATRDDPLDGEAEKVAETRQETEGENPVQEGPALGDAEPLVEPQPRSSMFGSPPAQEDPLVTATQTLPSSTPETELDPNTIFHSGATFDAAIGAAAGPSEDFHEPSADLEPRLPESELEHSMEIQPTELDTTAHAVDYDDASMHAGVDSSAGHPNQESNVANMEIQQTGLDVTAHAVDYDDASMHAGIDSSAGHTNQESNVANMEIQQTELDATAHAVDYDDASMHVGIDNSAGHTNQESNVMNVLSSEHHDLRFASHASASDGMADRDEEGGAYGAYSNDIGNAEGEATSATTGGLFVNGGEDLTMEANTANGGPVVKEESKPVLLTPSPSPSYCHYTSCSVPPLPHPMKMKIECKVEPDLGSPETNDTANVSHSSPATTSNLQGVTILPPADLASLASLHSLHSRPGADAGDAETYEQPYEENFDMDKRYHYGGAEGGLDFEMGNEDTLGQGSADLGSAMYGPTPMPDGMETRWPMGMGDGEEHS